MDCKGGARRLFGSGLALGCLLGAAPALAAGAEAVPGTPRRLVEFPVRLTPSRLGLPASVSAGDLSRELRAAARSWSHPAVPCTSVVFEVEPVEARRLALRDGAFHVLFRSSTWCRNERCGHLTSYPSRAAAMTTLYPEFGDGPIAEADIELNAVDFGWPRAGSSDHLPHRTASLRGVLVHELGHVLGLRDTCPEVTDGPTPRPPGAPQGTCDSAMLSGDHAGPSATDIRWLCAAYPRPPLVAASVPATPKLPRARIAWPVCGLALLTGILLTLRPWRLSRSQRKRNTASR